MNSRHGYWYKVRQRYVLWRILGFVATVSLLGISARAEENLKIANVKLPKLREKFWG